MFEYESVVRISASHTFRSRNMPACQKDGKPDVTSVVMFAALLIAELVVSCLNTCKQDGYHRSKMTLQEVLYLMGSSLASI